ncbi:MAG: DUF2851 family protein [Bacteroidaceae bacterium]|nr:DUF2851 family protein [Bacteroidaceae bacterium]
MKGILHYLWQSGILQEADLQTTDGCSLKILATGQSTDKKHMFKEARVGIGDKIWCGDVVIDCEDINDGSTILHVTLNTPATAHNGKESHLNIVCSRELLEEFNAAEQHAKTFPCAGAVATLPKIQLHNYFSRLLAERIEEKTKIVERIFTQCEQRWDDTLLKIAIRSFGFGIQSPVFDEWAGILNTQALGKHRDNPIQVEAILFGQAGLLDEESIPYYYRTEATKCSYYNELKREYRFLSNKFGLGSIDHRMWGSSNATPHLRIARIASLYNLGRLTISGITAANTLTDIYRLFSHPLNGYWQNHTCFGGTETTGNGCMKQKQVDVIIINSVIPVLYIYGKHRKEEKFCGMAEDLLHQIDPEENSIIKRWREQGVKAECAADSQALLQLDRSYCRTHNCIKCPFAYHYIKERFTNR